MRRAAWMEVGRHGVGRGQMDVECQLQGRSGQGSAVWVRIQGLRSLLESGPHLGGFLTFWTLSLL